MRPSPRSLPAKRRSPDRNPKKKPRSRGFFCAVFQRFFIRGRSCFNSCSRFSGVRINSSALGAARTALRKGMSFRSFTAAILEEPQLVHDQDPLRAGFPDEPNAQSVENLRPGKVGAAVTGADPVLLSIGPCFSGPLRRVDIDGPKAVGTGGFHLSEKAVPGPRAGLEQLFNKGALAHASCPADENVFFLRHRLYAAGTRAACWAPMEFFTRASNCASVRPQW